MSHYPMLVKNIYASSRNRENSHKRSKDMGSDQPKLCHLRVRLCQGPEVHKQYLQPAPERVAYLVKDVNLRGYC